MRIFINAVALKVAGAKSVCINFLQSLEMAGEVHEYFVFLPKGVGYETLRKKSYLKLRFIPQSITSPMFRYFVDNIYLRRQVKKIHPDVVFSMGNIALPIEGVPQLLLFHNAYAAYPASIYWKRIGWEPRLHYGLMVREVKKRFKYATSIAVQTNCINTRLSNLFGVGAKIKVIPNAVSLNALKTNENSSYSTRRDKAGIRGFKFLCLSRYYEHKNLEVFIPLAALIKEKKLDYKITVTIEENQHRKAARFLRKIKSLNLTDVIENIGPVKMIDVPSVYLDADALILPTLLESFSGTYIESAYYHRPVFTSDIDFAHEICGTSAIYFDPLDPSDILLKMRKIEDSFLMKDLVRGASENLKKFPDWPSVTRLYLQEIERISTLKSNRGC